MFRPLRCHEASVHESIIMMMIMMIIIMIIF